MLKRLHQIGLICALKKIKHMIFLAPDARNIAARNGAYEYLLRYVYAATKEYHVNMDTQHTHNIIWTCWLQGEENAPLIVRKCIESIRQYANGYKVVVLDKKTISEYISVPDFVERKYQVGIIPHAHYSDIVRLMLLQKYGGVWIDSTILLTDVLPDYILNADLFLFRSYKQGHAFIYNPFLAAKPNNPLLQSLLNLLLEYWKNEDRLVSYSIFHLFFTMAKDSSPINRALWEKVPFSYGSQMFYLQPQLGKKYDENAYQLALQLSSIHKLTYKFAEFGIDTEIKGTFYDVLINGNKPG